ncbi:MAG: glycosyltransferase [Gemmatimonadota bacterium]|nr:glycosyltransferase [Gemmatimonadota bacterium]
MNSEPQSRHLGAPVFLDVSGRRWRRYRRVGYFLSALLTAIILTVIVSILIPPLLPALPLTRNAATLQRFPRLVAGRAMRERIAETKKLRYEERLRKIPRSQRSVILTPSHPEKPIRRRDSGHDPIVAGFYVAWDDNSWASLQENAANLDWVICEWAFVQPGGDSLHMVKDNKPLTLADSVRPQIFLLVSNFDSASGKWDTKSLRKMLTDPVAKSRAINQLAAKVIQLDLAGVTLDFENVPPEMHEHVLAFEHLLRAVMQSLGRRTSICIVPYLELPLVKRYAAESDELILMLYDEHYGGGDPGPVASQRWYADKARQLLTVVPPQKAILAVGAYGYDWNDAHPNRAENVTFQQAMTSAKESDAEVHFDSASMNPYVSWTEPDSTDHIVWFLDGPTMYNQILAGSALGAAGHAIWRLGSEDKSIWAELSRQGLAGTPASGLSIIPSGYDPEFEGTGEILDLRLRPSDGTRVVSIDTLTGYVTDERVPVFPSPWVIRRFGPDFKTQNHLVALTFDDGPDGRWTAMILDTLRSRHAPATFFVIGQNVQAHIPLMRRIVSEGHEYGNHTYTHPNLDLTPSWIARLQIDATERLLEAVLNRRSAFFRPPYFGDAEPTTADELVPVALARDRGYYTIGLHIDSEDWQNPGVRFIVDTVLKQRAASDSARPANVILLHDSGGDRSQTVAALGPLIDSLRARGDSLVLVSGLVGISREASMPPLPARSAFARGAEFAAYGLLGFSEWLLHWFFLLAVILGVGRLVVILALAIVQRIRRHQDVDAPIGYAPPVCIIVPAYNEEKVINRTIETLLAQEYPSEIEIVVVDDGSPDGTFEVARTAYGQHPRVAIYRKPNGGKASALNYGLERAKGEIIICLDADTLFVPNTVAELVAPLQDPKVGAVAGNAKVGNRVNMVTRWQALEYVISQNLDRRAFSLLNSITVVPGAVGAWRKTLVVQAGGFSDDTLAEDQDLTLAIRRNGYSIAYADEAIGYTEAPATLRELAKQRFRWSFGTLQCVWKHKDVLFNRRYGSLGFVALPNTILFQLVLTALGPLADFLFLWSIVSVYWIYVQHGGTYAMTSLEQVIILYAIFLLVDWLASVIAFLMEAGEDRRLTLLVFTQRYVYRQVMYWVVVKSIIAAMKGRVVGWGKLERKATVEIPA